MADVILFLAYCIYYSLRVERFDKTKEKYIFHTIKKTISLTLSVSLGFNHIWRVNITDCVIQSWPSGGLRLPTDKTKHKPRVD